ncbi:MAG: DUF2975 domain-containing protein [Saprospiraceae bacterium]|nr:DUF2975 domain-containing protein [Saprospiraceae bacterium]
MKATTKISIPKMLRYAFLVLSIGGGLFLLLNLMAYFGLGGNGPFLRGEVSTQALRHASTVPLPDGGEFRTYDFKEQKLVMLDFATAQSFFQVRHMAYLLFQNMTWALVVFVFYQMFRIFKTLDRGETFSKENFRRIQWIAVAVLAYPITGLESELLLKGIVLRLQGGEMGFSPLVLLSEQIILGGLLCLVILALAEAFRHGANLQQEQDLTI